MGQQIELDASDGHRLAAYVARPAGTPRGGLVVIQEIFGVNSHIRSVVDGYAADGYLAIAPAVFDRARRGVDIGYTEADIQVGFGLKTAVGVDGPIKDVAAALAWLVSQGVTRSGVLGYCFGGLLTWLSASRVPGFAAAVPYYGGGIPDHAGEKPLCPVMAHFGDQDHWLPMDAVNRFQAAQPGVQVHVYNANHGFNCDQRASYNAAAARLARERTLAFFAEHLS